MQLGSDVQIRDGLLAENTLLSEKPRLGFERTETTVHQASIRLNYLNGNRVSSTVVFEGRPVSLMAQQPLSSVSVLGRSVGINYGKGLSLADELAASGKIGAAAGLINANADSLSASDKKAIGQISSFTVAGPGTYLGATGKGSMTLSAGYIEASSAAWVGSLFGHEGQHYLNAGKYSGDNLWRDEQSAGRTQLGIGNKIGFGSSESRYLEQWIDDRNRNAMQQHMQQGYSY